jgi:murein DD-endopeptidase MepM/ murein hydrolase activator NlpD
MNSLLLRGCWVVVGLLFTAGCGDDSNGGGPTDVSGPSCLDFAVFDEPSESDYVLPYPLGDAWFVVQSYCTTNGSHRNQLAYDFRMDLGAPIAAARSGVVVDLADDFSDDGIHSNNFNFLVIRHDVGTYGFYAHHQQGSARVQVGEAVSAGQHIANAGQSGTGLPCVPRDCAVLHFQVSRTSRFIAQDDVGVNFRNTEGFLDQRGALAVGSTYLALPD